MESRLHFRSARAGIAVAGLLGASSLFALSSGLPAGAALPGATTFNFVGSAQTYTVPANVCAVTIEAIGAGGGTGGPSNRINPGLKSYAAVENPQDGAAAGLGGRATSTVQVTPGESLGVYVGGRGTDGVNYMSTEDNPAGEPGGWNGGGDSGIGAVSGGSGGGSSDVRQGGSGLTNRVVVAGGGGGGGGYTSAADDPGSIGGNGGNPATPGGDVTVDYENSVRLPAVASGQAKAKGGGAATQQVAGTGGDGMYASGENDPNIAPDGTSGASGQGGVGGGGGDSPGDYASGGGGGGGLFGGGGGGAGYQYAAAGGGGGSSLGDATTAGVNADDGQVTITPSTTCPPTTTKPAVQGVGEAKPAVAVATKPTYTG